MYSWPIIGLALVLIGMGARIYASEYVDPYAVECDSYSMPAVFKPRDFYSLSRLFIQPGNTMWQADNYKLAETMRISQDGQEWVRWHFIKKTDTFIPSLAYRYPARINPVQFSMQVFNRGKEPIAFSGWGDNDAKNWQTVQPGEESLVTLAGMPTIVAQGTKVDREYDVNLRDLTVHYPEAEGLSVTNLEVPAQFVAGKKIGISLGIQGQLDKQTLDLEVRNDPWVVWRIHLSEKECGLLKEKQECDLEREVPWYLSPGEVSLGLVADGRRIKGTEGHTRVVNEHPAELPRIERRLENGRPTFILNGKPFIWSGYATYFNFSPAVINEFAANGANLFHITCAPGRHYHNVSAPTWLGGDEYDFGEIEQWATTILQANPDAKLILRLALGLPPFWFTENPDSLVRIQTTDGRELIWQETDSQVASLTSKAWREQQAVVLRKLIQYCASRPWASQVVGFNLGGALTEEWFAWASCDEIVKPVKLFSDYSPANQQAFREWCSLKGYPYEKIPEPKIRKRPDYDLFADDENGRWAAAYNLFINEKTSETLRYFAAVVKEETQRRSLVGAFFGYVVLLTGEARQSDSGQFGVREVLESEDIDYLGGVPQHLLRRLCGDGYAGQPTAIESVLAHGKQYMDDNDLFSWLHEGLWHTEYDAEDPRRAIIEMHRRWQAPEAIHGNSWEWFSLSPKWHRDDGVMEEFAREARIQTDSLNYDRTPTEEIAFVIDDYTFSWLTPEAKAQYANQVLMGALGRTGAPMGIWLLSDLDRLPDRIKFVAVVNAGAPRGEDLEKLRSLIQRGGRTLLVVGVTGLVDPVTLRWNPAGLENLLGLPIRLDIESKSGRAALVETGEWLCPMQANGRDPELVGPRAYLEGEGFMKYEDGKIAAAERPLSNGGRLIWCGVPPYASEAWLRDLVVDAGVHCYAPPPCSVHASKDLVSITSVSFDDRDVELSWPEEVAITDLYDGWTGRGRTFSCPFKHGQTRLFKVSK
jgi:hypothetical protein